MKLKYGDVFVLDDCIGKILNAGVNQECLTVRWVHNPHGWGYYLPKSIASKFHVLQKDVAENLLEVLKRNEQ